MKFSTPTTFLGRNGIFTATGICINEYLTADFHSVIVIEPLTSRSIPGRCNIEIPIKDIPHLIAELQAIFNKKCRQQWSTWVVRYWDQDPVINDCCGNAKWWSGKARNKNEAINRAKKSVESVHFRLHSAVQSILPPPTEFR